MRKLIVLAAALAVAGCTSATSGPSGSGPTTAPAATAPASTPATTAPPAPTNNGGDWCALAARIGHDSGLLVGTHFISPLNETLDQLKIVVNESLANRDALLTGLPPDVHAAMLVEGDYFEALQSHNFSSNTPAPAGLNDALAVVKNYETQHCGFVFDK